MTQRAEVEASASESGVPARSGRLALSLQEIFTVIARIRADRQVAEDADSFREHVKRLLSRADSEARGLGYDDGDVRLALYAVVAFLDESVLNSPRQMFSDWPGRPLQEEVFGDHMAGETFYRYLDDLLGRQDSHALADLLEVFQLCLVLGFRGRYGGGDSGERSRRIRAAREKIDRVRGPIREMAPAWRLPEDGEAPRHSDPWVRRLAVGALGTVALAIVVLITFRLILGPGAREILELSVGITG
ncbi:MAG: DotU family type IV/VI secretion system protein [Gemmatimonadales bacterium]|nr:MAG: DotU family type IV/VI secretion system protein [Gemmatimonadales bacterium]